jgi:HEAT repeat protein
VSIKASSTKQITALVADLGAGSDIIREAAVARLTLIGGRAVGRLVSVADSDASGPTRIGAFRVLDAIGHLRALAPALRAIDDTDSNVAIAAIGVARRFLRSARGAEVVDRLTATALDRTRPNDVRVAALHALRDLDPPTIAPLLKSLAGDPVAAMSADPFVTDEARAIRQTIARRGGDVALSELLRLVEQVRDREAVAAANRREEWATARAAVHLALAKRGSKIALYDLREWLETARQPLPVESLAALSLIGDASCLEPIAKAHARSRDEWWRQHLAEAFRSIIERERITKRKAVMKKIEKKWPETFRRLSG